MNEFCRSRNLHNRLIFDKIIFFETTLSRINFNLLNDNLTIDNTHDLLISTVLHIIFTKYLKKLVLSLLGIFIL